MSLGAVVVVLIVSTAPADPTASALNAAAQELLGNSASVRVELTPRDLSDAETLERAGQADGVVELAWTEGHGSALLHCYVAQDQRWVDRRITFGATDSDPERGRLLGFAIASMFPRLAAPPPEPPPPAPPARAPAPPRVDTAERVAMRRTNWQLQLAASATTGIRGPADAIGTSLGLRRALSRSLAVHAGVSGRVGDIPLAQASTRVGLGALGLAWSSAPFNDTIELGWRADLLGSWFEASRERGGDGVLERRSRWMFGGAALLEGGYRISQALGLYGGAGTEALFGETDVYAEGQLEAKLPTFRVVGELGLRAHF